LFSISISIVGRGIESRQVKSTNTLAADAELVAACKIGKAKAQQKLYDRYCGAMLGVAMRYADNQTEAEDILQEAFINVFKNIGSFEGKHEGSLTTWIKTIVVNAALTNNRKNKKHNFTDDVEDVKIAADEDRYHFGETMEEMQQIQVNRIMSALSDLPIGYRTVFNLYVVEGYSHQEIAEILEISENTSKSQLSKARKFLKNKLGITTKED
jgi:RNA polymerase sigma-70 factor (ECF subfamily)